MATSKLSGSSRLPPSPSDLPDLPMQRQWPRAQMRFTVHFRSETAFESGEALDLSGGGMLLATDRSMRVGTRFEMKFSPPGVAQPLLAEGVVVRHHDDTARSGDAVRAEARRGGHLHGVRFDRPEEGDLEGLDWQIREHLGRLHDRAPGSFPPPKPHPDEPMPDVASAEVRPRPGAAPDDERRRASRITGPFKVAFRSEKAFAREYALNISATGMLLRTDDDLPVGTELEIELELPNYLEPLQLRGRVVRRQSADPSRDQPAGVGIEFIARQEQVEFLHAFARVLIDAGL